MLFWGRMSTSDMRFLIREVRLFDGVAARPSTNVLVQDGTVLDVATEAPEGWPVVEGAGRTLLPGLIDSHTHVRPGRLEQAVLFGVTTELDMFADPAQVAELKRKAAANPEMADLRSAGIGATAPGGHPRAGFPDHARISSPSEAERFVADRVAEGSDYLKIVVDNGKSRKDVLPTLDAATVAALVKAAHGHGLLAVAHATDQAAAVMALDAGVDGLAHLFVDGPPAADFGVGEAFVIPTLTVLNGLWGDPAGSRELLADPLVRPHLDYESVTVLGHGGYAPAGHRQGPEFAVQALQQVRAQGARVLAGTDASAPTVAHGASLHQELALLVEAGLTPVEALAAATSVPVEVFGLADRGVVAAGRRADLVLVDGDPTVDILATRAIVGVWRGGVRVR
jgi:imidazolonepropionase-like amidohydrolase